jgi:hypothetical protein
MKLSDIKFIIGERTPPLIIGEEGGKLKAYTSNGMPEGNYITFHDEERMIFNVTVLPAHDKDGYLDVPRKRFLYSMIENEHIITATGYPFTGPVELSFRDGSMATIDISMYHVEVSELMINRLHELFCGYKEGLKELLNKPGSVTAQMGVYDNIMKGEIRAHELDNVLEEHEKRLDGCTVVPFPSFIQALENYDSVRTNLPLLEGYIQ